MHPYKTLPTRNSSLQSEKTLIARIAERPDRASEGGTEDTYSLPFATIPTSGLSRPSRGEQMENMLTSSSDGPPSGSREGGDFERARPQRAPSQPHAPQ